MGSLYDLFNQQLVLLATVVGAVAALPTAIQFWIDARKRQERVSLALEDEPVRDGPTVHLAGLDAFLEQCADLVDAAANPDAYHGATTGNEILVVGGPLSGKRSFAKWLAESARMDRLVTVHAPRDPVVLSAAKRLLARYRRQKVLLLLPNLDRVFAEGGPDLLSELDALIDDATEQPNVLVVATATRFEHDSDLDNLFGVKLVLPGAALPPPAARALPDDAAALLREVAAHYLDRALEAGCVLVGIEREQLVERVVAAVENPAEVEDVLQICRTSARFGLRSGQTTRPEITAAVLERATRRVVLGGR